MQPNRGHERPFRPHSCGGGVRPVGRGGASASLLRSRRLPAAVSPVRQRSRWLRMRVLAQDRPVRLPVSGRAWDAPPRFAVAVCVVVVVLAGDSGAALRRVDYPVASVVRDAVAVCCRCRACGHVRAVRAHRRVFRPWHRCGAVGHFRAPLCRVTARVPVRPGFSRVRPVCGTSSACVRRIQALRRALARRRVPEFRAPARGSPVRCR